MAADLLDLNMLKKADKPPTRTARLYLRVYDHEREALLRVAEGKRRKPSDILRALLRNYLIAEEPDIYQRPRPSEPEDTGLVSESLREPNESGEQKQPPSAGAGGLRLRSLKG